MVVVVNVFEVGQRPDPSSLPCPGNGNRCRTFLGRSERAFGRILGLRILVLLDFDEAPDPEELGHPDELVKVFRLDLNLREDKEIIS